MDSFVTRKRSHDTALTEPTSAWQSGEHEDEDSTETKLAILASLYPNIETEALLDALLASEGCVALVRANLTKPCDVDGPLRKKALIGATPGYQSSLTTFSGNPTPKSPQKLTRKGKTLSLYAAEDIAAHTPCSIIHNFLPSNIADALLRELLEEVPTFTAETFRLFDNVVTSPHTMSFYVDELDEARKQQTEYVYNGSHIADVRRTLPQMRMVSALVQEAVNDEITKRIKTHYSGGRKLRYQSPHEWVPNTSFVNCYDGGKQSVGYHSDQLTYLGPRAVIGSISLGVAREFRVRRVVPRERNDDEASARSSNKSDEARADIEGQIAIHLPHNSLLVMHAEMQEEWKHSIAPAPTINPHPIAGNKRLNITYRNYRESLHPQYTPRCKCDVPAVLRCVQKKAENRGRYMWMCHAGYTPGQSG